MSLFRPTGPWRMTGSASQAMDVVFWLSEAFQRRGPERRYTSRVSRTGGWRMTGSASQAMDVMLMVAKRFQRRGPERRYTSRFFSDTRLADDGKRL